MHYKIHPLHMGTFTAMETSNLLYQTHPGLKVRQPILAWLITGGDAPIVVDTGASGEEWAVRYHHSLQRSDDQTMKVQLAKHGVQEQDVRLVINTHLHWDHCFQNDTFHQATFLVQKREIHAAVAPIPTQRGYYEVGMPGVTPGWMKTFDRTEVMDGDIEIKKGIELVLLPGHTPGLQGVVVQTEEGPYLIASDTIGVYENWTGNENMKHIPQGIHYNLEDYFATFSKMERIGAQVLPSHDMRVLEYDCFG